MSKSNPLWGAPHIVGELAKIGINLRKSTVEKDMARRRKPPSATWRAFLFNVTANPTARWTAQQVVETFPWTDPPTYLLRDRDTIYGQSFQSRVTAMGFEEVLSAARSPWQNPWKDSSAPFGESASIT